MTLSAAEAAAAEDRELLAITSKHARFMADHGLPASMSAADTDRLRAEHVREPAALSTSGVLFGPDCSQYQGKPAWASVYSSGCRLGFYKVSEGRTYQDPSHQVNRAAVPAAGLIPGGYHFLYYADEYAADPSLWAAQARFFVSLADPLALHFLDVEAAATAGHWLGVREWVAEYRRLLPSHGLGLYTNRSLWRNRSRMPYDPAGLFDYVWHAGIGDGYYTTATGSIAAQWSATSSLSNSFAGVGYPDCRLWQITDHASVAGVAGTCDGNAFQGSAADLRALVSKGDDSMSAADVEALKTFITSEVDRIVHDRLANPWVRASGYGPDALDKATGLISPVGMIFQNYLQLRASLAAVGAVVADDPSLAQIQSALAASAASTAPALSSAIVEGLRGALPREVTIDPQQIHGVVAQALDEHLGSLRIVSDAPPA